MQRANLATFTRELYTKINDSKNRPEVLSLLEQGSEQERLFVWKALKDDLLVESNLLRKALEDPSIQIKIFAISKLKLFPDWKSVVIKLLNDRVADVRYRYSALRHVSRDLVTDFSVEVNQCLFDDSKSVRALARYLLGGSSQVQFNKIYEARLKESAVPTRGALFGFIETAQHDISDELIGYLHHSNSRVRSSALLSLARFHNAQLLESATKALSDKSKSVVATAANILIKMVADYDRAEIKKMLFHEREFVRSAALRVLARRNDLELARDLLTVILSHEELRDKSFFYLKQWFQRFSVRPYNVKNELLVSDIEALIKMVEEIEGLEEDDEILSHLKSLIRTL